jgi:NAD(P)-dependent dehydrogenase (short-subunit alcohol dehydrogenase family)
LAGLFRGKAALVTVGSSGIGRAAAVAFAREGARVAIAARREFQGEQTAALIRERGGEAVFVKTDVSESAEVETMVAAAVGAFGRLDCAFNNAGTTGPGARIHEYGEDGWDDVIATTLTGVWLCMKYEIRYMLAHGGGAIVNDSSAAGVRAWPRQAAYAAAKHGVIGLTRTAAREYAKDGIRVNAVCPGWTETPMVDDLFAGSPERRDRVASGMPMGRMGAPEEVAETVIWLCSDAASYVNGDSLMVDGGQTI